MTEHDRQIFNESIEHLRTVEPVGAVRMSQYAHSCGTPSCAAGYLREKAGVDPNSGEASVELLLSRIGAWSSVFAGFALDRVSYLNDLGIDMDPGADKGVKALRDAADRLEAVRDWAIKEGLI